MIVVTEKGFIHLSGCYEVVCLEVPPGDRQWFVMASWGNGAGATLHRTPNEAEARRLVEKIGEAAWGDDSDTERRICLKDLL